MADKEYKLDIFELLNQIDKKNILFYSNLKEDEKKGFLPTITLRWLYGTTHELQILLLNHLVNPYIFNLSKHPNLIYKLFTTTAIKSTRYKWKPKLKDTKFPLSYNIISKYFEISIREAKMHFSNFTSNDIILMAKDIGIQNDDIKKIKQELKNVL
jgi:hypothetical protein